MTGPAGPTIIIAATPTSNGDLHVGHMAGPYLASDIYARYLRANGRMVLYSTCTDDSQTYVTTTAHRQGTTPELLCAASAAAIVRSLEAMGISMAGLPPIDDRYRETVLRFMTELYEAGRFRLRTVRLPYAERAGTYLFDGLVSGKCPVCLTDSSGGVCEGCGHPNNFDELLDPFSSLDPTDPISFREQAILVLPMEEYRDRLTAYYEARKHSWRPHAMQLIMELLARPLPEVPVTIPGEWGIPAPFHETPGQVLYPWVEAVPASIYSTWWTAAQLGEVTGAVDEWWRAERDAELIYFHGFDNVYHWGLMDLVLLMAHGDRYVLPVANVCNEFYDLEGEKFSTSRQYLIWSTDLLNEVPRDLVRFFLAATAPEHQRTNFSKDALRSVVSRRLVEPWNALAEAITQALVRAEAPDRLPTTPVGRARCATMVERFRLSYDLSSFSLGRTADTIACQLARLRSMAEQLVQGSRSATLGDLLLETRTLLAFAAPILIDAADHATRAGVDLGLTAYDSETVPVFRLAPMPEPDGTAPGKVADVSASPVA